MNKKVLKTKEVMKNNKNEELLQKRLKNGIVQYFMMNEELRIVLTDSILCEAMHELIHYTKKPFPNGEVMLLIQHGAKYWISSSMDSLIALKENKIQAMFYIDMDNDFKNNN